MTGSFYQYLETERRKERVAGLLAAAPDPHEYIANFLDGRVVSEGMGGFFQRLGQAWRSFWGTKGEDGVSSRFQAAVKALTELQQIVQKNNSDPGVVNIVLRGLEQSLTILKKIEPSLNQSGDSLPPDLERRYNSIMTDRDRLMVLPDSEEKLQRLLANDDKLAALWDGMEDEYQRLNGTNPEHAQRKKQIKSFLYKIHMDNKFREIQNLLDFARGRTRTNMAVSRPAGYEQVVFAWRAVAAKTADPSQQRQGLSAWYRSLPPGNPVRAFVRQEMAETGGDEMSVFWKYAKDWINNMPHYLARSQ